MVKTDLSFNISFEQVFWLLFSFLFIYAAYAALSMRIFYPDGTIFFIHLLENQTPVHWHWDRQFAYYVQHFPLISSIKLGIRDIHTLARIHTAWYFSFGLLSLLGCYLTVPKDKIKYLIFPILWMFGIYLQTEFFPITPGRLLTCIYWFVLFQLLFRKSWISVLLIILFAWPTLRIYQGMMILGPFLAFFSLWKYREIRKEFKGLSIAYLLLSLYFIAGAILSFISVLDPQDKTSFLTFIFGLVLFIDEEGYPSFPLLLGLVGTLYLTYRLWRKPTSEKGFFSPLITIVILILGLATLISPITWPEALAPETHQQVRSINIYISALLSVILFISISGKIEIDKRWLKNAFSLFLMIGLLQIYWNICATYNWNKYLNIFTETLETSADGLVLAQHTTLLNLNDEYGISNGFHNDWDSPLMSILFAPDRKNIRTIIAHSYDNIYHPLNPRKIEDLPDLSLYGVSFSKYIFAFNQQDSVVIPDRDIPEILKWLETKTTGVNDFFE